MACIPEFATGYPGYNAIIPRENGFLSEVLAVDLERGNILWRYSHPERQDGVLECNS